MSDTPILDTIRSPEDVRALTSSQLNRLAEEIRTELTTVVADTGGHLASNLGVVELTLALHRVYDFSKDRLIFDVGHQCYVNKLITGRREKFSALRQRDGITGFPCPAESEYDPFYVGHASTGVSTALGMATGFRLAGEKHRVVTVVGDASIVGGMSFEGLNNAGHAGEDVLIVLNENNMAIAETVGAFSTFLTEFRSAPGTRRARAELQSLLKSIPLVGSALDAFQERALNVIKNQGGPVNVFSALGFRYFGPLDGHDLGLLERELHNLKQIKGPVLLHVVTTKGKGADFAAAAPETFHSPAPFEIKSKTEAILRKSGIPSWSAVFTEQLIACAREDERIVTLTAAMPAGTGTDKFKAVFPGRFFDVGICEQHAVTFAAGLARAGMKPVVAIYSTFLQRAFDQIIHDVALQPDLPIIFAIDRAGFVGADGRMHHGLFDIAYLRSIPGLTLMAPRDAEDLRQMLTLAFTLPGPVAIRYPRGNPVESGCANERAVLQLGKSERLREGKDGTVFAYGRMVVPALRAAVVAAEKGVSLTVINGRFAKPLDREALRQAAKTTPILISVEDHFVTGGFGSAISEVLHEENITTPLLRLGVPDRFIDQGTVDQLDQEVGLDIASLTVAFVQAAKSPEAVKLAMLAGKIKS